MSAIHCRPSSSSFRRSSRVKGASQPPLMVQVPRKIPEHTRASLLSHTRTRMPRFVPHESSLSLTHQQSQPGPPTSMAEIVLWDSKLGRETLRSNPSWTAALSVPTFDMVSPTYVSVSPSTRLRLLSSLLLQLSPTVWLPFPLKSWFSSALASPSSSSTAAAASSSHPKSSFGEGREEHR